MDAKQAVYLKDVAVVVLINHVVLVAIVCSVKTHTISLFCPLKDSEGATVRDLTLILNDSDDDLGNDDYGIGEDEQQGRNDTNETSCATDCEDWLDDSDPEYDLDPESIDLYDI